MVLDGYVLISDHQKSSRRYAERRKIFGEARAGGKSRGSSHWQRDPN
jgi:hypothetical protein